MVAVRRELDIREISLVKDPANPAARVTLFKSGDSKVADKSDDHTVLNRLSKGFDALAKFIAGDAAVVDLSKLHESLLKRAQALPEEMQKSIATLSEADLAKEDGAAHVLITALEATAKAAVDKAAAEKKLHDDEEDKKKKAAAEEAAKKEAVEKKAELDKSNLPEAVIKTIETLQDTVKTQAADLESTKAVITKMTSDALEKSVRERALKLSHVILAENMAGVVQDTMAMSEDARDRYFKMLETADASVEKSDIFTQLGSEVPGEAGTAYQKIEAEAVVLMKTNAKLTKEQAIDEVMKQQPDLYAAYKAEKPVTREDLN